MLQHLAGCSYVLLACAREAQTFGWPAGARTASSRRCCPGSADGRLGMVAQMCMRAVSARERARMRGGGGACAGMLTILTLRGRVREAKERAALCRRAAALLGGTGELSKKPWRCAAVALACHSSAPHFLRRSCSAAAAEQSRDALAAAPTLLPRPRGTAPLFQHASDVSSADESSAQRCGSTEVAPAPALSGEP